MKLIHHKGGTAQRSTICCTDDRRRFLFRFIPLLITTDNVITTIVHLFHASRLIQDPNEINSCGVPSSMQHRQNPQDAEAAAEAAEQRIYNELQRRCHWIFAVGAELAVNSHNGDVTVSSAKTAEAIEMPYGVCIVVRPKLEKGLDPPGKRKCRRRRIALP